MKTHWWAVALIVTTTIFTTTAQYFFKIGAELPSFDLTLEGIRTVVFSSQIFSLWPLLAGFVSYGIGAVLMILAFRGGEVTVLYPIVASSYVWVVIMSSFAFGEPLNALKIIGSLVLVWGIFFIAKGSDPGSSLEDEVPL